MLLLRNTFLARLERRLKNSDIDRRRQDLGSQSRVDLWHEQDSKFGEVTETSYVYCN